PPVQASLKLMPAKVSVGLGIGASGPCDCGASGERPFGSLDEAGPRSSGRWIRAAATGACANGSLRKSPLNSAAWTAGWPYVMPMPFSVSVASASSGKRSPELNINAQSRRSGAALGRAKIRKIIVSSRSSGPRQARAGRRGAAGLQNSNKCVGDHTDLRALHDARPLSAAPEQCCAVNAPGFDFSDAGVAGKRGGNLDADAVGGVGGEIHRALDQ